MHNIQQLIDRLGIKNQTAIQSIKYMFVGGTCTVLDFLILYIGAELLGLNYLPVSVFSFLCGVVLNYFLCTYWIFKVRVVNQVAIEFGLYVLISLVGLAINTGVIYVCTGMFGLYVMASKLLSAAITYFWNFFARKFLLHYQWGNKE